MRKIVLGVFSITNLLFLFDLNAELVNLCYLKKGQSAEIRLNGKKNEVIEQWEGSNEFIKIDTDKYQQGIEGYNLFLKKYRTRKNKKYEYIGPVYFHEKLPNQYVLISDSNFSVNNETNNAAIRAAKTKYIQLHASSNAEYIGERLFAHTLTYRPAHLENEWVNLRLALKFNRNIVRIKVQDEILTENIVYKYRSGQKNPKPLNVSLIESDESMNHILDDSFFNDIDLFPFVGEHNFIPRNIPENLPSEHEKLETPEDEILETLVDENLETEEGLDHLEDSFTDDDSIYMPDETTFEDSSFIVNDESVLEDENALLKINDELPMDFNPFEYLRLNTDLNNHAMTLDSDDKRVIFAQFHYLDYGRKEKRPYLNTLPALATLPIGFDALEYLRLNQDLTKGVENMDDIIKIEWLKQHFINHGKNENRRYVDLPVDFDPLNYISSYQDLVKGTKDMDDDDKISWAMYHYSKYGKDEGRSYL